MRLLIILVLISFIYTVSCKTHVKALTASMGQEVIEINNPIKELPMGLEEEPDSEKDDKMKAEKPETLKDEYKQMSTISGKENMKDIDKIDGLNTETEEDRIEKELAEIYKDTADYKSDSEEEDVAKDVSLDQHTQETTVQEFTSKYDADYKNDSAEETDDTTVEITDQDSTPTAAEDEQTIVPIGRQRYNFKLHPDSTRKADIEKFRTSVDEINCNNKQLLYQTNDDDDVDNEEGKFTSIYPSIAPRSSKAFYTIASRLPIFTAILYKILVTI